MHRTRIEVEGHPYDLFHNGDYSGDVKVFDASIKDGTPLLIRGDEGFVCELPYELMEGLVMAKLRQDMVSEVEQMDPDTFKKFIQGV